MALPSPSPDGLWLAYPEGLRRARVLDRPNRFVLDVLLDDGTRSTAWLGDPGRLTELGRQGWDVLLEGPHPPPLKPWRAVAADAGPQWVSLRPNDANLLARRLVLEGRVPGLAGGQVRPEFPLGRHRFDLCWTAGDRRALVEAKSASLVLQGVALFPDAVSERATRHVEALLHHAREGWEPRLLLVCQRADARVFRPAEAIDPAFAEAFRRALRQGLQAHAWAFPVSPRGVGAPRPIPVDPGTA